MKYRLPDNIGYIIGIEGHSMKYKAYYFKKERKGKKKYVAQQRVYLTKKEGNFEVFCETNPRINITEKFKLIAIFKSMYAPMR